MARLGIREEDLEETFVRSSGPGGQHVNKTATAVALTHRPSGVTVRCQKTRSQAMNRFYARRILLDKIERQRLGGRLEAAGSRQGRLTTPLQRDGRMLLPEMALHGQAPRSRS